MSLVFLHRLRREWGRAHLSDAAAALAFYSILALFPFLLLVVALAGPLVPAEQLDALVRAPARQAPAGVLQLASARLQEIREAPSAGLLTFSALGTVWSAMSGVASLTRCLNVAYGVSESRQGWKLILKALAMMFVGALLALVAALLAVAVPALYRALPPEWVRSIDWLRWPAAALLMMTFWGGAYYVPPDVKQPFRRVIPGAVVGVLVWLAASGGFSAYVSSFLTFRITYGALGAVIILLLWIWISALALVLGAVVNAVLSRAGPSAPTKYQR